MMLCTVPALFIHTLIAFNPSHWFFGFPHYANGDNAYEVFHADLDMDGDQDVIQTFWNSAGMLRVVMNLGNNRFAEPVEFEAVRNIYDLDIVDMDGDGDFDIVGVSNYEFESSAFILKNNGAGIFGERVVLDTWSEPRYVKCDDIDADGDYDIVVAHFLPGGIGIILNEGDEQFGEVQLEASIRESQSLDLADIDMDGDLDILSLSDNAYGGAHPAIQICINDGAGGVSAAFNITESSQHEPRHAVFCDVDLDGNIDIITVNLGRVSVSPSSVGVFKGNGDATFEPMQAYHEDMGRYHRLDIEDFNADGFPDIVLSSSIVATEPRVQFLLNDGTGGFVFEASVEYGSAPRAAWAVDINNDGEIDLLSSGHPNGFVVAENRGGLDFEQFSSFEMDDEPVSLELLDVNGDSHLDILVGSIVRFASDAMRLHLGDGTGTFVQSDEVLLGRIPTDATAQDINNDGITDLIAITMQDSQISVSLGRSDGGFNAPSIYPIPNSGMSIGVGDIDCDNAPDIVLAEWLAVSVYKNFAGVGAFFTPDEYPVEPGVSSLVLADFDTDGIMDIAATNERTNELNIFLNTDCGSFGIPTVIATLAEPLDVLAEDLDGDGAMDLILSHGVGEAISILHGNGDGTFETPLTIDTGASTTQSTCLDVDQDGDLDIAIVQPTTTDVTLILNDGNRVYTKNHRYITIQESDMIASGDINNDGSIDIITASSSSFEFSVMYSQGPLKDCPADLSADGTLNFLDVSAFLAAFGNQDPAADFETDGNFNFLDVSAFLAAFGAGCP